MMHYNFASRYIRRFSNSQISQLNVATCAFYDDEEEEKGYIFKSKMTLTEF
jgi:hypothetical protein